MSIVIPGFFITTCFLLVTYGVFVGLLETSTDQNESVRLATEDQAGRLNTLVSIDSVSYTPCEYTATAQNKSDGISFGEFSEIDVFNRYSTSTGATLATRRAHDEGWYISSITPDNTNPNVWDPGERAGVSFGLSPLPQTGGNGTVAIAVPGGVSDSAYFEPFDCPFFWPFYWHNDPTPPTGDTASHAVLTTDDNHPTFTGDLPNYDTDRDAFAGLVVQKGGSGVGETDPTKYQVWRSGVLSEPLVTVGTIFIDFWAGLKDFQLNAKGQVTVFIRDRSATGDYTEIGSGTLADQDWQGRRRYIREEDAIHRGRRLRRPGGPLSRGQGDRAARLE